MKVLLLKQPVFNRLSLSLLLSFGASAGALSGVAINAKSVMAQALLPYTLPLDEERLREDGERLAQDAFQLAQFQQFDEALARAQLAAQLLPNDSTVLALLGNLYLQASDPAPDKAIDSLERAKELEPDNPLILFNLGTAYFSEASYWQAARSIEAGLKLSPDNPNALFDLGNVYYKLDRFDQAIAQYEKAISSDAAMWPAVNNIGLVMYENGDVDGAIAQWTKAIDLAGEEQTEPLLAIAVAKHSQGSHSETDTDSAVAGIERDPRYAKIEFLEDNLWGEQLIAATEKFFSTPSLQALLDQL
ncbi:MAG: tetratricopeptide repeat protein [Phormidesmis sp.]